MNCLTIIIILVAVTLGRLSGDVNAECRDIYGRIIRNGMVFIPENSCVICVCQDSVPKWCNTLSCFPPKNCKSFTFGSECCKFKCLDEYKIQYEDADNDNTSTASTVKGFYSYVTFILLYWYWQI